VSVSVSDVAGCLEGMGLDGAGEERFQVARDSHLVDGQHLCIAHSCHTHAVVVSTCSHRQHLSVSPETSLGKPAQPEGQRQPVGAGYPAPKVRHGGPRRKPRARRPASGVRRCVCVQGRDKCDAAAPCTYRDVELLAVAAPIIGCVSAPIISAQNEMEMARCE